MRDVSTGPMPGILRQPRRGGNGFAGCLHGEAPKPQAERTRCSRIAAATSRNTTPQAASSQGTARNSRPQGRAGEVPLEQAEPAGAHAEQQRRHRQFAAERHLRGNQAAEQGDEEHQRLGIEQIGRHSAQPGPQATAAVPRRAGPASRRAPRRARSAPTPSQARYSAPSACRMANSTGVRLSSSDTPVSTRWYAGESRRPAPARWPGRPAALVRDVRTTRATSGPGLDQGYGEHRRQGQQDRPIPAWLLHERDRKGKRESALAQARRR